MSPGATAPNHEIDPLADASLAARLLAFAPEALGGMSLRGGGPARDLVLAKLREWVSEKSPWRRLPANADQEGLLGGVDIAASLAQGRAVHRRGLLHDVADGFLIVPMAERLRDAIAGQLAQAMDERSFAALLLDDGIEVDEGPAAGLSDRMAFICDLTRVSSLESDTTSHGRPRALNAVGEVSGEQMAALANVSAALGVDSVRPLLFAHACARAHAALNGRSQVEQEDLTVAVRLVLAPRATQIPQSLSDEEEASPPPPEQSDDPGEGERQSQGELPPDEMLIEAALAAIPPDVLAQIAGGRTRRNSSGSGGGKRSHSTLRGKPLSARPGTPRGGARLALIDSLRAAAPWQPLRRRERGASTSTALYVDKDDLRIRRFEERAGTVTIFCVDASGSAAVARLAEAKGAVERILAQAYVNRSEVALVAFRGEGAELLLPPTRSLTRARRALSELPGGGGTPLASGLQTGLQVAEAAASRGRTPFLVVLTDGSANIAADGSPGRAQAKEDALSAARALRSRGVDGIVIDISPRPRPDAGEIAQAMDARYLPLPMADAAALERAVSAAQPEPQLVR